MNSLLDSVCGRDNWVAYCINLKRATERRISFEKFCNDIDLSCNFFEATDKLDMNNTYEVIIQGKYSPGATACKLSHERLLQHFIKEHPSHQFLFIFEDDAGFSPSDSIGFGKNSSYQTKETLFRFMNDVSNSNIDWDCVHFGYYYPQLIPIHSNICKVLRSDLTHAMLFNRKTCENLLRLISFPDTFSWPIDFITQVMRRKEIMKTIGPTQTLIDQIDTMSFIWS